MTKAIVRMRSVKKLFWLIIQNSQERTCAGVIFNEIAETPAQVFSYE